MQERGDGGDTAVLTKSGDELSQDLVYDLLSSPRRRMVLYYLRNTDGTSTVLELAEQIAAIEYDTDVESLTRQQEKRVYVSLYQTHVPKLADAGIITYDQESGDVRLTNQARRVDEYLTTETEEQYPWHYHYLTLAGASLALLVLDLLNAPLVSTLPVVVLGALVIAAFAISGFVQYLSASRGEQLPRELTEESF